MSGRGEAVDVTGRGEVEAVGGGRGEEAMGGRGIGKLWRGCAALVLALACASCATRTPPPPPEPPPLPDFHLTWEAVLHKYVEDGEVDYKSLRASREDLKSYLSTLEGVSRPDYLRMTREEQLAFWINAHNAYAVDLVLEYWPVGSILEATPMVKRGVGGAFGLDFIPLGQLLGGEKLISLDDIKQNVLDNLAEPRAHFALARACRSCPELRGEPYRGETLDAQLDDAGRRFLATPAKNRLDAERRELILSGIFQWNALDFAGLGGPIGVFHRYGPGPSVEVLESFDQPPIVRYPRYDWSLNKK